MPSSSGVEVRQGFTARSGFPGVGSRQEQTAFQAAGTPPGELQVVQIMRAAIGAPFAS